MALDPMHLVFVYEAAHWRKRTTGSHFLRKILSRLCDRASSTVTKTPIFYSGEVIGDEDDDVRETRYLILSGGMRAAIAEQYVKNIEEAVIDSANSLCMHLAALTASYPQDVEYRSPDGRTLSEILHTATAPNRIVSALARRQSVTLA